MNYQLVSKKLENGNFKLAVISNGEFQDAESDANLEEYVTKAVMGIALAAKTDERLVITIVSGSEMEKK